MYFNTHFKVSGEAEHLNILLEKDSQFFIAPVLVSVEHRQYQSRILSRTKCFFQHLIDKYIIPNDRAGGIKLLSHLHEPEAYRIGYSQSSIHGRAVGQNRATFIYDSIRRSYLTKEGVTVLHDPFNLLLFVEGVGQDIISDITANVCRDMFSTFTQMQCETFKIPCKSHSIEFFDDSTLQWVNKLVELPEFKGEKIILIPMWMAIKQSDFSEQYFKHVCKNYIVKDLERGDSKNTADKSRYFSKKKNGEIKPIFKNIYKDYRTSKKHSYKFMLKYGNSLSTFYEYIKSKYK